MTYNITAAIEYYRTHIILPHEAKLPIYQARHISPEGIVPFRDWEVFAAVLVDDVGSGLATGSDLVRYEIKSAKFGGSFEYQYHRNTGLVKLSHDLNVDHLFIIYSDSYRYVDVYLLTKDQVKRFFAVWQPLLESNYLDATRQRFRRSIPYGEVTSTGTLVLQIRNAALVFPA